VIASSALLALGLGVAAVPTGTAAPRGAGRGGIARQRRSFPCQWTWTIQPGFFPGYVNAGNSADCGGISGSLTLSTRLQEWSQHRRGWKTVRSQKHTWHHLGRNHFTEVRKRCDNGKYRAKFRWILHQSGGAISRKSLRKGAVVAPVGCRLTIG
jgi:hypothetical protein